jgi:DNA-binding transcriptional LysR family regulator
LTDGLRRGDIALALTYDIDLPGDLELELLGEVRPHVLLPAGHPLAAKNEISLADLADEPMVLLDIPPSDGYFTSLFDGSGLTPRIAYRSPSFEMVRGMVGHGLGYALLATKPANSMTYDGQALVTRGLAEETPASRFVVARKAGSEPSALADAFLARCRDRFG